MHRLQISLTEAQYEFLKSEAFVSSQSMAAVLRNLLDEIIQARQQEILQHDPIWRVIGVASEIEGPTNISSDIDAYLYGQPLEPAVTHPAKKVAEESDEYLAD